MENFGTFTILACDEQKNVHEDKVRRASEAYDLFYKTKEFDPKQYFISKTL